MKIKREIVKMLCCALALCLCVFCKVLAEENQDEQIAESGQDSANGGQMERTVSGDAADELREISAGMVILEADSDKEDIDAKGNGYIWKKDGSNGYVLTLKNVRITGSPDADGSRVFALKVPSGEKVVIKTEGGASVLAGGIKASNTADGVLDITFDGAALRIEGVIASGTNNDRITVQNGANVEITQRPDLGASSVDSHISVSGHGSLLTIGEGEPYSLSDGSTGYTFATVAYLHVTEGGKLIVKSPVGVLNEIEMGENAVIENVSPSQPTLHAGQMGDGTYIIAALDGIKPYIPPEYHLGKGIMPDGITRYYTILDADGNIVTGLTLRWLAPLPPQEEESTTAVSENVNQDSEGSSPPQNTENGSTDSIETEPVTDSGTEPVTESVTKPVTDSGTKPATKFGTEPVTESGAEEESTAAAVVESADGSGSKVLDVSPYTGDRDSAGLWAFFALSSAVMLFMTAARMYEIQS